MESDATLTMSEYQLPVSIPEELIDAIVLKVEARMKSSQGKPLTISQFAEEAGESKSTIRRRVAAGVIARISHPGDIKISWDELERYRSGKPA